MGVKSGSTSFHEFLVESYRTCLILQAISCDNTREALSTREAFCRFSAQGFIEGWSPRHPSPNVHLMYRLWKEKLVFSTTYILCTNSLGTMSSSYQGIMGTLKI